MVPALAPRRESASAERGDCSTRRRGPASPAELRGVAVAASTWTGQLRRAASRSRLRRERLLAIPRPPPGVSVRRARRLFYASARPSLPSGIAWGCRGGELLVRPPPTRCELGGSRSGGGPASRSLAAGGRLGYFGRPKGRSLSPDRPASRYRSETPSGPSKTPGRERDGTSISRRARPSYLRRGRHFRRCAPRRPNRARARQRRWLEGNSGRYLPLESRKDSHFGSERGSLRACVLLRTWETPRPKRRKR